MKQLSLVACMFFVWQCVVIANAAETKGIETLLGKSISEGVARLYLKLDEYFVVDEPPCVPRGIRGQSPSGGEVSFIVQCGDVPFRENCKWRFEEFANKRIIGIMQRDRNNVYHSYTTHPAKPCLDWAAVEQHWIRLSAEGELACGADGLRPQLTRRPGIFVTSEEDILLGRYETRNMKFEKLEIGDRIVYWHQRIIEGVIVEGDFISLQFDKVTEELLKKKVHWRDDLPEHLNVTISKEKAEAMVNAQEVSATLYIISPESKVFPTNPSPKNPCWVVKSSENRKITITIIDAVTGTMLGHGVSPP